ncbi:MAG: hypothetical protein B7Z10_06645 [Rhodobacterales bacterium 32-66-7]|nr:MAG: hypothetical protein B7Z10_06645 [Rhodobacterales bacterium 32-66-7]
MVPGNIMLIETRTKRRWLLSVLDTAADETEPRLRGRTGRRQLADPSTAAAGQKGFVMRLKAVARPLSDAAR